MLSNALCRPFCLLSVIEETSASHILFEVEIRKLLRALILTRTGADLYQGNNYNAAKIIITYVATPETAPLVETHRGAIGIHSVIQLQLELHYDSERRYLLSYMPQKQDSCRRQLLRQIANLLRAENSFHKKCFHPQMTLQ